MGLVAAEEADNEEAIVFEKFVSRCPRMDRAFAQQGAQQARESIARVFDALSKMHVRGQQQQSLVSDIRLDWIIAAKARA